MARALVIGFAAIALACSSAVTPRDVHTVDVATARTRGGAQSFRWEEWSRQTFERARRERRFILLHGAAVWCHWCHVMEETTYRDPEIGRILSERFVAIRVDIDARPDIAERYGEWGWPATIVLGPDAEEIGKYRGYLPPDELRGILNDVGRATREGDAERLAREPGAHSAPVEALPWVARRALRDMDWYYDPDEGGWGMRQKAPLGENAEVETRRAGLGDTAARARASFTLEKQRVLIDPVWGGIYQYSTGGTWKEPHFEKLATYQAPNIEAYARGYRLTGTPDLLRDARSIADYVERFLKAPDGAFHPTQDADVGSHDRSERFIDGNDYYPKAEKERLSLGIPRVDPHVYAYENGLLIAALVTLFEVSGERAYLARAERAANRLLGTHVEPSGAVRHDATSSSTVRHLADAAGLGRAYARLAEATGNARYREAAERIAAWMLASLADPETAALFAHTPDPDASGVFARRRRPFDHNVLAARFLCALSRVNGDALLRDRAVRMLAAISTPAALDEQGRMLGGYLLALDEAGIRPW